MSKYAQDAKVLLENIGGKENISAMTHCVTRLRFVLVDQSKANVEAIEAIPSIKGSFTQAGQFQIIIGNDVDTFYNELSELTGIQGTSKDAVKEMAKSQQNLLQRIASNLAEIFAPLIPAIVVGGLILGFRNILEGVDLVTLADGTKDTIANVYPFWGGVNHFLWLIGEAIFHFLPVGITWSITRKWEPLRF